MLINEVCKRCKLTKKAVEYYEEQGLICPKVMENGYRAFSEDDVVYLSKIAILRELGLSVSDIKSVLTEDCYSIMQTIFYKGIMPSEKVLDFPVDCNTLTGSVNL